MKKRIYFLSIFALLLNSNIVFADNHKEGKKFVGAQSGYEGREQQLGRSMAVVLKSLNETSTSNAAENVYSSKRTRDA